MSKYEQIGSVLLLNKEAAILWHNIDDQTKTTQLCFGEEVNNVDLATRNSMPHDDDHWSRVFRHSNAFF